MLEVLSGFPEQLRQQMRAYWRSNGGMSRRAKFDHFFREVACVPHPAVATRRAVAQFGALSLAGYLQTEPLPEALELAKHLGSARAFVTSGAEQQELQRVFRTKQIDTLFAAILGSPKTKRQLVQGVLEEQRVAADEALLIGDGARDYEVCRELGMHFVYLAAYSEWDAARQVLACSKAVTWGDDWPSLLAASGITRSG
jgi:phosphoglycolate phosphatase-like HAD superfamily hydrolase